MICLFDKPLLGDGIIKKRQADYIAPLQPLTLAAFPPWEGSAGAGRVRPAGRKYTEATTITNPYFISITKL